MSELDSVAATLAPDLLRFENGAEADASSWPRRRGELARAIVPHEYGGMPPAPDGVEVIRRSANLIAPERVVAYHTWEIRASVAGGEIRFPLSLWIPPGDGPFPVILDGDGCWRYFNDEVVRSVLDRGYIAASFDRTALAADNPDHYRETGLYRLMPGAECGALAAWAWAGSTRRTTTASPSPGTPAAASARCWLAPPTSGSRSPTPTAPGPAARDPTA